jgi:DNA-binding CsgD family transcriptional regulator
MTTPRLQLCGGYAVAPRPCAETSCRYHLAHDLGPGRGRRAPRMPIETMKDTCALDVAELGGQTLEEVASRLNITRERVRQIEEKALAKLERAGKTLAIYTDARRPAGASRRPNRSTSRVAEMLKLRAEGLTNREIGDRLGLATSSVTSALSQFRAKGGAEVMPLRQADEETLIEGLDEEESA